MFTSKKLNMHMKYKRRMGKTGFSKEYRLSQWFIYGSLANISAKFY